MYHLIETATLTKQKQCHLRIHRANILQHVQKLLGLCTFLRCIFGTEDKVTNWSTQDFKVEDFISDGKMLKSPVLSFRCVNEKTIRRTKLLIFSLLFNMESPALLGQKRSSMVLGAASRNIGKMIILLSARWICLMHSTLCLGRLSWRNVESISQSFVPDSAQLVLSIAQDKDCLSLLSNRWYLDDGVLSGHSQAVTRAVTLIQEMGPSLGLFINVSKCELFGHGDLSFFPPEMKVSRVPNLGAPIGDPIFCAKFLAQKHADAAKLLSQLAEVGAEDPQVAFLLLRQCAAFCKLVHLARSTPPSYVADGLALFDKDVRQCFSECTALDISNIDWMQAQLSLSRGGLGLRSLSCHSVAAYLASLSMPAADSITEELLATSNLCQHTLSSTIEDQQFRQLFDLSSPAHRARLLSVSSRHAASWLTVILSPGLNLHLEPNEFQVAIKLDLLGHHALTCKHGGDVVLRHNSLSDVFVESCHRACLGGQVEVESGLGLDRLHSHPADVLVNDWHLGKPAAFDLTARKHNANDSKCAELGWVCIPLAVESYGCWGTEAQQSFSRLAARLAIQMGCSKSQATTNLYQRLSLSLVRANARALLSRARFQQSEEGGG
ncbi:hypothetical protein EMCRGX_G021941 [Ephydatia muelleri]